MTQEEFDKQTFKCGTVIIYNDDGKEYDLISVNFDERLIGFGKDKRLHDDIFWARCENVTIAYK